MSRSSAGKVVGVAFAPFTWEKNDLDRASVAPFFTPGMCTPMIPRLRPAAKMNDRVHMRCIALSFLLEPDHIIATIAALSHRQRMAPPVHLSPHTVIPNTTGSSYGNVQVFPLHHHKPEASDINVAVKPHRTTADIIPVPFHINRN